MKGLPTRPFVFATDHDDPSPEFYLYAEAGRTLIRRRGSKVSCGTTGRTVGGNDEERQSSQDRMGAPEQPYSSLIAPVALIGAQKSSRHSAKNGQADSGYRIPPAGKIRNHGFFGPDEFQPITDLDAARGIGKGALVGAICWALFWITVLLIRWFV